MTPAGVYNCENNSSKLSLIHAGEWCPKVNRKLQIEWKGVSVPIIYCIKNQSLKLNTMVTSAFWNDFLITKLMKQFYGSISVAGMHKSCLCLRLLLIKQHPTTSCQIISFSGRPFKGVNIFTPIKWDRVSRRCKKKTVHFRGMFVFYFCNIFLPLCIL